MNRHVMLVGLCVLLGGPVPAPAADPGDCVVKVTSSIRYPNPVRPWSKGNPIEMLGTGTVIEGKKILTSAHLVLYATEVHVEPRRGGERIGAKVEAIAPDMDLALLSVADEPFLRKRPFLVRSKKLPRIQDTVAVHGFPVGGSDLAVTKGVVSRIDFSAYDQQSSGLVIQVSAPINPGNSGGPGVVGDEMIGIVRSRYSEGENIGYIVPNEEIDTFLEDIKDGHYDGKPREATRAQFQRLQNAAMRSFLKLTSDQRGIMVIPPDDPPASSPFRRFDVLTRIGEHDIDNEGMVQLPNDLRVSFLALVPKLAKDGAVPVSLFRDGKRIQAALPVSRTDDRLLREFRGEQPAYFIHGPLVFSPANADAVPLYLRVRPSLYFEQSPLVTRYLDHMRFPGEELVVVAGPMFAHKITSGYGNPIGLVVREVNGTTIRNLRHLVEVLRDAKEEFLTFRFAGLSAEVLVFRRQEMEKATEQILDDNGIAPSRRGSEEVLKVWKKGAGTTP
jgi:S1-C subfamily serine protease